jgi:outer membrane protein OmpA-like peptidoglycan-associated protein
VLTQVLPAITAPGLVISGGDLGEGAAPRVEITAAEGLNLSRGLTIAADGVQVRGLSLYGFASNHTATETTPPGDILISDRAIAETAQQVSRNETQIYREDQAPKGVVIAGNWLGIKPDGTPPQRRSAFGVSVFNAVGTRIENNRIAHHDGSGIITTAQAKGLMVLNNQIIGNGVAGMPDAIRLEGRIDQTTIQSNLICANDGSGIYLFKPEGAVKIIDNRIKFNGRRLRRAAVYLMGQQHQVTNNEIMGQTGPGVVVSAWGNSDRNLLQNNRFAQLEGLSIDLITARQSFVQDFQTGDGPNPPRNSRNRRPETGNAAIDAPRFASREFFLLDGMATVEGQADPNTQVDLYQVLANDNGYGALNQPLGTVQTDGQGKFMAKLPDLTAGMNLSAIATDQRYGTSEPALSALVRNVEGGEAIAPPPQLQPVECQAPVAAVTPEPEPEPEPEPLKIPRNVHFGLDQDSLSAPSQQVLDRVVTALQSNPGVVVELHGHTDPRASRDYNEALATRRARRVRDYLVQQGIAPERLTIRTFGETQRRTQGQDKLDYARDRRVELVFKDLLGAELVVQEEDLQLE